ncbi:MAG: cytochrome c [Byssovorax sp.]
MRNKLVSLVLVASAAASGLAACSSTLMTPIDQIPKLTKLDDVMDNQSTVADPEFKKIGQASYTDADYAAFAVVSERIQATALKTEEFAAEEAKGKEDGFKGVAKKLAEKAKALGVAAAAKDAAASSTALKEMKEACKECHSTYR